MYKYTVYIQHAVATPPEFRVETFVHVQEIFWIIKTFKTQAQFLRVFTLFVKILWTYFEEVAVEKKKEYCRRLHTVG